MMYHHDQLRRHLAHDEREGGRGRNERITLDWSTDMNTYRELEWENENLRRWEGDILGEMDAEVENARMD